MLAVRSAHSSTITSRGNREPVNADGGGRSGRAWRLRRMSLSMPNDVFPLCNSPDATSGRGLHRFALSVPSGLRCACGPAPAALEASYREDLPAAEGMVGVLASLVW